ncbi:MAG: hypothetical protein RDV41_04370 [Planctomycetota bacterium]|nr:hypothetical protein [Planctomycetota bacterium]
MKKLKLGPVQFYAAAPTAVGTRSGSPALVSKLAADPRHGRGRTAPCLKLLMLSLLAVLAVGAAQVPGPLFGQESGEPAAFDSAEDRVLDQAARAFFEVHVTFLPYDPASGVSVNDYYSFSRYQSSYYMTLANEQKALVLPAVLVDNKGALLLQDPNLNLDHVREMTAVSHDGKRYSATPAGILRGHHALLLKLAGFDGESPLAELPGVALGANEPLFAAGAVFMRERLHIVTHEVTPAEVRGPQSEEYEYLACGIESPASYSQYAGEGPISDIVLFFDDDANAAAIAFAGQPLRVNKKTGAANYLARAPRAEDALALESIAAAEEKIGKMVLPHLYKVRLDFRQLDEPGHYRWRPPNDGDFDQESADKFMELYGIAVKPNEIFVPQDLPLDTIRRISEISVHLAEGKKAQGAFAGLFKEFGGFRVVVSDAEVSPCPGLFDRDFNELPELDLFFTLRPRERFEKLDERWGTNRFSGVGRVYKNRVSRNTVIPVRPGTFMVAADGAVIGFCANEKLHELAANPTSSPYSPDYENYGDPDDALPFSFKSLRDQFETPEKFLDLRAEVMSIQESKKVVCIGVEFQGIGFELAKALGIEKETQNGRLGLLVTVVYPGMTAEKLGLQPGDILLKIKEKGKANEVDLAIDMDSGGWGRYRYDYSEYSPGGSARMNYLTAILTKMRAGTEIDLTYAHKGKKKTVSLKLEAAPDDFNSGPKTKNELTGLTVKDITYEVRHVLRLPKDFKGVVVYKVEPGSSAAVAGIMPREFITRIGDAAVVDPQTFERVIGELVAAGKKTAQFTVRHLDRTRFVDMKLEKSEVDPQEMLKRLLEGGEGREEEE